MKPVLSIEHTIMALGLVMLAFVAEAATPLPWIVWDHSVEVDQVQGVTIREAAFGPTTNARRCDQAAVPMTRLLFPPISGSFTRPNADETLYIYWFCDDAADAFVVNRVLLIAAGNKLVAIAPHHQMRRGGIAIQAVAAVDLDGDGLMELVEEHGTLEYSAAHVFSISDTGTTRVSTVTTSLNACGLSQYGNWSMELAFSPDTQPALAPFSGKRTYHPCDDLPRLEVWLLAQQYEELAALRSHDPADYAVRLLALAQLGYIDAQLDIARLYRDGDILPRNTVMADWWQERADMSR